MTVASQWLGIDVGAERKGFDVALIDERALLELRGGLSVACVVEFAVAWSPVLVAVDGPRTCAPDGHTARNDERELARAVCGIRWTPDRARVQMGDYYAWVRHGLELFGALATRGIARHRGVPDGLVDALVRTAGRSQPSAVERHRLGRTWRGARAAAHQPGSARRHRRGGHGAPAHPGAHRPLRRDRRSARGG